MIRLALGVTLLLALRARAEGEARWLSNYPEARQVARKTGKPIFVVFRCEH